jgi:bifunctional DNA-binding transcriptional regulator/antitoxin component of YhaV-PrlF toxin-antitoxin module
MISSKIVRPQSKGMVTIPVEFRQKLGITEDSVLQAQLTPKGVLFVKMDLSKEEPALYSDSEIEGWMEEDRLDAKTARKLRRLLQS